LEDFIGLTDDDSVGIDLLLVLVSAQDQGDLNFAV
jgi:hypothetical protein